MPAADQLIPRREADSLFQSHNNNGVGVDSGFGSHKNPFTSDKMSNAPLAPTISPDMLSPQTRSRRRHHNGGEAMTNTQHDEFMNYSSIKKDRTSANISTMIRERQLDRMMMVSPENNNDSSPMAAAAAVESAERGGKSTVAPMVTPMAMAASASAAVSTGGSSQKAPATALTFETPQKTTPDAHKVPFPSNQKYSPLTPNTNHYISNNSPFKSSMQLLDQKLQSVLKMEGKLDSKINERERYYEDGECSFESSIDAEGELQRLASMKIGQRCKSSGGERVKQFDKSHDEHRGKKHVTPEHQWGDEKEHKANSSSVCMSDAISELSAETEDYSNCGSARRNYVVSFERVNESYCTVDSPAGTSSEKATLEFCTPTKDVLEDDRVAMVVEDEALLHNDERQYDSDSESFFTSRSKSTAKAATQRPRRASFDSSCASSSDNKYKQTLHYLMEKEGLHYHSVGGDAKHMHRTVERTGDTKQASFSMDETFDSGSSGELRRVLWADGSFPSPSQKMGYDHVKMSERPKSTSTLGKSAMGHHDHVKIHQRPKSSTSSLDRAGSSQYASVAKTPVTYPGKKHQTRFHYPHDQTSLQLGGTTTPLAPKQLYQSRIDEIELSSSDDDDNNDDDGVALLKDVSMMSNGDNAVDKQGVTDSIETHTKQLSSTDAVKPHNNDNDQTGKKNSRIGGIFKRMKGSNKKHQPSPGVATTVESITNEAAPNSSSKLGQSNSTPSSLQDRVNQQGHVVSEKKQSDAHVSALLQQHADTQHQLQQVTSERTQLLNMVSEMRSQLTNLTNHRDTLVVERNFSAKKSKKYKKEVKSLQSEMEGALRLVKEVQDVTARKEEETIELRRLVKSRDYEYVELQSTLALKEEQITELSSATQRKDEEWIAKLSDAERQRFADMERITVELNQKHIESNQKHIIQLEQMEAYRKEEVERARTEMDATSTLALEERVGQLFTSHSVALDELRNELQSSSAAEIERVRKEAEKQRLEDVGRLRMVMEASSALALEEQAEELSTSHAVALDELKVDLESSASAEIERVRSEAEMQRLEEVDRARVETEASSALELEAQARDLSTSHDFALQELRADLESSASVEIERVQSEGEKRHLEELERLRTEMKASSAIALNEQAQELSASHDVASQELKAELQSSAPAAEIERVQSEGEKRHLEDLKRLRSEMEESSALSLEEKTRELSASYVIELDELRNERLSSYSKVLERVQSQAEEQHLEEVKRDRTDMEDEASTLASKDQARELSARAGVQSSYSAELGKCTEEGDSVISNICAPSEGSCCNSKEGKDEEEEEDDSYEDMSFSFYIGQSEGFCSSESVHESDISETASEAEDDDDTDDLLNESYSVDESIEMEASSPAAFTLEERAQQVEHVRDEAEKRRVEDIDRLTRDLNKSHSDEMETLKSAQTERLNQEDLECLRLDMESSASISLADKLDEIDRLKDELTNAKIRNSELMAEQEKVQSDHAAETSTLHDALKKSEAKVDALRKTIEEMESCHRSQTSSLKASFDEERLALMYQYEANILDFMNQIEEKDNALSTNRDETDAVIASISSEKKSLVMEAREKYSSLLASQEENVIEIQKEKAAIEQQLDSFRVERAEMCGVVEGLKKSLGEAVTAREALGASLTDARQNIASLDTERTSQSNCIEGLEHQLLELKEKHESIAESLSKDAADQANKLKKQSENERQIVSLNDGLQNQLSDMDSRFTEMSTIKENLLEKYLHLVKEQNDTISEKNRVLVEAVEKSSLISSLEAQNESLFSAMKELEAKHVLLVKEIESTNHGSKERSDLLEEKLNAEKQLTIACAERDQLSVELEDVKDQLSAVAAESDSSMRLDELRSNRIEELEQQIAAKERDSKDTPEISDLIASRDILQEQAANLAITVIKQKMRYKKSMKQRSQSAAQNEKVSMLERCLDEVKADRKALASKLVQQHEKLFAAAADNRVLFETLILHERDFENACDMNLASTPPSSLPREKWMVAKLASTLVTLKAREMNLSKEKSSLKKQVLDHQKLAMNAQNDFEKSSKEKSELNSQVAALSNEKCNVENDFLALGEKVTELENSLSAKDNELRHLQATIMNKNGTIFDLSQQNEQLKNESANLTSEIKLREVEHEGSSRTLILRLQSQHESLKEVEASLQLEKEVASELKGKLEESEDALLELQAAKLCVKNRLEEVLQEKDHLSTEVGCIHDNVTMLEADLQDCQEKTVQLSNKVTTLEQHAASNEHHILSIESQLVSKFKESEALSDAVNSHEVTLDELRNQMQDVLGERDGLASQLEKSAKELASMREERNSLATKMTDISIFQNLFDHSLNTIEVSDSELYGTPNEDHSDVSPQKVIREILNSSSLSESDVDRVREKMSKVQTIIAHIEEERKLLKKEVKHLRAGLERARGELATAKKDNKKVSRQTLALRDVVSQARTLLEKTEEEKNHLVLDLENAQKAVIRIQKNSSQSYNAIVAQSHDEIKKLKTELKEKNESIKLLISTSTCMERSAETIDNDGNHTQNRISMFDISFETVVSPGQRATNNTPPKVTSKDRFKVDKGSMFGMLKDMKKSGRKDKVKYRKVGE